MLQCPTVRRSCISRIIKERKKMRENLFLGCTLVKLQSDLQQILPSTKAQEFFEVAGKAAEELQSSKDGLSEEDLAMWKARINILARLDRAHRQFEEVAVNGSNA